MDESKLKKSFKTTFQQFIYTDGERLDYNYVRLARGCEKLTFDKRFLKRNFRTSTDTPFKEIRWATKEQVCDKKFSHLLKNPPEYKGSFDSFLDTLKKAVKTYLREVWDPNGKYLILHSSGYDSRIISMSLAELRDEGLKLGEIHFRCHQPECPEFFKIMRIEGWDKSQYSRFPGKNRSYYDIGTPISTNGFLGYGQQMNFWSDIIPQKEEKNWYNVNGWEGAWFRFIALGGPKNIKIDSIRDRQLGVERYWAWEGMWINRFRDMIQPFLSYRYLDAALRVRWEWCEELDDRADNVRVALQDKFDYDLSSVPRKIHDYNFSMTFGRKKSMLKLYYKSKFYKKYRRRLRNKELFKKRFGWDARLWGFAVTVYRRIQTAK